jgi:hypothetical protein
VPHPFARPRTNPPACPVGRNRILDLDPHLLPSGCVMMVDRLALAEVSQLLVDSFARVR